MQAIRAARAWLQAAAAAVERSPRRRAAAHAVLFCLNAATAGGAFWYLNKTRDRARVDAPRAPTPPVPAPAPRDSAPQYSELAASYDSWVALDELVAYVWLLRRWTCRELRGDCLEVACGTLRNLPYFPRAVKSCTFVDPSDAMLRQGRAKLRGARFPVQLVEGRAENLRELCAASGQQFDTVFETFGLCSHEDPVAALRGMAAVLRPGGRVVLLEHGRGDWGFINGFLDRRAEKHVADWGCRWNLDLDAIVRQSGLQVVERRSYHLGSTKMYVLARPAAPVETDAPGVARKAPAARQVAQT